MKVRFTKMHGTGNDFVIINEFKKVLIPEKNKQLFVQKISDRHIGVGSDGVIFVQKSKNSDAKFHFFNPDGSIAEMCGNGIRCFAKYLYETGIVKKKKIRVETLAGEIVPELTVRKGIVTRVKVEMGRPRIKRGEIPVRGQRDSDFINQRIRAQGRDYKVTAVGMGNPHAIIFSNNIDRVDVKSTGGSIRYNLGIFPRGTNVHFLQKIGNNRFRIRSYERGVEDETLACGTGICASAVAAVLNKRVNPNNPVSMVARGGTPKVKFKTKNGEITEVYLIGPAEEVFQGSIEINL